MILAIQKIKKLTCLVLLFFVAITLTACTTNPISGRSQMMIISPEKARRSGAETFHDLLGRVTLVHNASQRLMAQTIFDRITHVADQLYFSKTHQHLGFIWQLVLIDEPKTMNAFALPGGKLGIYSGMLPIAKTNAGLASIIGHEVAHVILRHGAERVSNASILNLGGFVVGMAGGAIASRVYGTVTEYGYALPFSRHQETEADVWGLELSARAGYDPRAVIGVWQRMEKEKGEKVEFLSTHPNPDSRVDELNALMPKMMRLYEKSHKQPTVLIPGI